MARKRTKKITLNEFRAWLEGVEELQPNGWSPDADQWQLIRDKIKSIKDEEPVQVVQQQPPVPAPSTLIRQSGPAIIPPAPPVPGGIPNAPVTMSPDAARLLNSGEATTKTPDVDSSDGTVASPFV